MSGTIGEFEQLILLAVLRQGDEAYGVTIRRSIHEVTGRDVSAGAVYTALGAWSSADLSRPAWPKRRPHEPASAGNTIGCSRMARRLCTGRIPICSAWPMAC